MDCLEYLLFGKIPNYNKNDVSHVVFFSVGIMLEQNYQEGVLLPISIDYDLLSAIWQDLQPYDPTPTGNDTGNTTLSQTDTYSMNGLIIQLKHDMDADGKAIGADYIIFDIWFFMDTNNTDYKTYGSAETLSGYEIQMRDAVESVVKQYTEQEFQDSIDTEITAEILHSLQNLFQSDFIYRIALSGVMYQ